MLGVHGNWKDSHSQDVICNRVIDQNARDIGLCPPGIFLNAGELVGERKRVWESIVYRFHA